MEKLKILIVGDNKNNLVTLKTLIDENFNVDVIEAQSALTALDLLMKQRIDLLILDVQMPDMDGFQLTELIRSRKKTDHIPIILLTAAYISDKFKQQGFELGVEDYITKPINYMTLIGRIKSYLRPIQKEREFSIELERKIKERTSALEMLNQQMIKEIQYRKKIEEELIIAKEQLENASIEKSKFLSTMSHEIRTPLNAVIGMSYLLMQENPRPDQLENLKVLKFSAENLLVLINDILDFSKIEAGKITFEELDFSLREIFNSIKQSLLPKAEEKSVEIFINYDQNLPDVVVGDPVRLAQILYNLISNAVKFTIHGGILVEAKVITEEPDAVTIVFSVSDTGIGIPEEMLTNIFESFVQASSDTTRKFGGTGLGLAITKRLLELQKSMIKVESKVGKGSKFYFELTFKKGKEKINSPEKNTEDFQSLKGTKILLAEDSKINQVIAIKFLKKWDIETDIAENGLEVLEKLRDNNYHLILMDIQMPEMDGYEATEKIRNSNEMYKDIPILALTASAMAEIQGKVLSFGMNDLVTKPFNQLELYRKIAKYLA